MSTETTPITDEVTTAPPKIRGGAKSFVEQQLKNLLMQEMAMRQQIKTAKTNAKKNYFKKKLRTIDFEAKAAIAAIRRMQSSGG